MGPEQLIDGLPYGLTDDAPQAVVHTGKSLDSRAPAPVVNAALVHLVPEFLDFEGVLPDQGLAKSVNHPGAASRCVDDSFGDMGLCFNI
jgi:hypothetical protein